jgi:ABC-type bacteriocin/lantibiotic exporter with double-glycine peptidase domain
MNIPHILQENDYFCGPAIIAMVLGAFGRTITQQEAAALAQTNEEVGTPVEGLVGALKGLGVTVEAKEGTTLGEIEAALAGETICIVCYTEPVLEWGHYAIVEKIENGEIALIDPDARTGTTSMMLDEFERRWKDPLFTKSERWAAFVSSK